MVDLAVLGRHVAHGRGALPVPDLDDRVVGCLTARITGTTKDTKVCTTHLAQEQDGVDPSTELCRVRAEQVRVPRRPHHLAVPQLPIADPLRAGAATVGRPVDAGWDGRRRHRRSLPRDAVLLLAPSTGGRECDDLAAIRPG